MFDEIILCILVKSKYLGIWLLGLDLEKQVQIRMSTYYVSHEYLVPTQSQIQIKTSKVKFA